MKLTHKTFTKAVSIVLLLIICVSVVYAQSGVTVVSDFESGSKDIDGWSYVIEEHTPNIFVSNQTPINGEYSLRIEEGGGTQFAASIRRDDGNIQTNRAAYKIRIRGDNGDTRGHFMGSDGELVRIFLSSGNDRVYINHNTGQDEIVFTINDGDNLSVEIYDIDWQANTFKVAVNNTGTATDPGEYGPYTFRNTSASGFDRFYFQRNTEASTLQIDDLQIGGDLYHTQPPPGELIVDSTDFLKPGESQTYTVSHDDTNTITDVTDQTNVTSFNTSLIIVDESANTLTASSDNTGSTTVQYSYNNFIVNETVFVGNRTIENIENLPPEQYIPGALGFDDTQSTSFGMGSEIQWVFLAILIGSMASWKARNEYVGIGVIIALLILFWVNNSVSLGILLVALFYGIFIGYIQRETPSRSDTNVGSGLRPPPR